MILIDPHARKQVEIDGATFTLRPWTRRDWLAIAECGDDKVAMANVAVVASLVGWSGVHDALGNEVPFSQEAIAMIPAGAYFRLFAECQALSVPTVDEVRV